MYGEREATTKTQPRNGIRIRCHDDDLRFETITASKSTTPAIQSRPTSTPKRGPPCADVIKPAPIRPPVLADGRAFTSPTILSPANPLGFHFLLPRDLQPGPNRRRGWRTCRKCEAVFFDGNPSFKGACQRGGPHASDPLVPEGFTLEVGVPEDAQNQSNWKHCRNCLALFWAAQDSDAGLCPASGMHEWTGELFRVPHVSTEREGQPDWRFCNKCFALSRH